MKDLDDIEAELRFLETDKEHRSLQEVIDSILDKDEKKREFSKG